jgi:hypothetical protein
MSRKIGQKVKRGQQPLKARIDDGALLRRFLLAAEQHSSEQ